MSHLQSILHPAGVAAARISQLWWTMFWICTAVWIAVAVAALIAIRRGHHAAAVHVPDRTIVRNVATAAAISIVALIALLSQSVLIGRALNTLRSDDALRINVTANQWWWDIQYDNAGTGLMSTNVQDAIDDVVSMAQAQEDRASRSVIVCKFVTANMTLPR